MAYARKMVRITAYLTPGIAICFRASCRRRRISMLKAIRQAVELWMDQPAVSENTGSSASGSQAARSSSADPPVGDESRATGETGGDGPRGS